MLRSECKLHQVVFFGRPNGEQTKGKVVKLNPTKAKVETLEERGNGRGNAVGTLWTVPYSMMTPANEDGSQAPAPQAQVRPLEYNVFQPHEDQCILEAIVSVYNHLSPENLACDGEISRTQINRRYNEYQRKLKALFAALGRTVSEEEAYRWSEQKRQSRKPAVLEPLVTLPPVPQA